MTKCLLTFHFIEIKQGLNQLFETLFPQEECCEGVIKFYIYILPIVCERSVLKKLKFKKQVFNFCHDFHTVIVLVPMDSKICDLRVHFEIDGVQSCVYGENLWGRQL